MPSLRSQVAAATFSIALMVAPHTGSATVWNIDDVLSGTNNFGASLFHTSSNGNPMSGSVILNFTDWDVSGTYNDISGQFDATFTNPLNNLESFSLMSSAGVGGELHFEQSDGSLNPTASLDVDFTNPSDPALFDDTITFVAGFVCCGLVAGDSPNSFSTTTGIMALWGATQYDFNNLDYYDTWQRFGSDIRLQLTPVPLPAALPLFGGALGIIGLLGWRRRGSKRQIAA